MDPVDNTESLQLDGSAPSSGSGDPAEGSSVSISDLGRGRLSLPEVVLTMQTLLPHLQVPEESPQPSLAGLRALSEALEVLQSLPEEPALVGLQEETVLVRMSRPLMVALMALDMDEGGYMDPQALKVTVTRVRVCLAP